LYKNAEDREALIETLRARKKIIDFVCQARRKDGSTFWVSMNVQLIYDADNGFIGTEGAVRDITDRKRLEEENLQYKDNLEQLVAVRTASLNEEIERRKETERKLASAKTDTESS